MDFYFINICKFIRQKMLTLDGKTLISLRKGNLNRLSIHRSAPIVPDVSGLWLVYGEKVKRTVDNTQSSIFKPDSYADVIFIEQNGNSCSIKSTLKSDSTSLGMITPEGNMLVSSNPVDNTMTTYHFQKDENEEVVGLTGVYSENALPTQTKVYEKVEAPAEEQVEQEDEQEQDVEDEEVEQELQTNKEYVEVKTVEHNPSVGYFFAEKVKLDKSGVRKAKKIGLLPQDY